MNGDAPAANDYVQALQNPRRVFSSPVLQEAVFVEDSMGMPLAVRGASAAVFQAKVEGRDCALRCFLRIGASSEDRNEIMGRYLEQTGIAAIVRPVWLDNEVRVRGSQWPVLRMEWVDGDLLSYHVGRLVESGDYAGIHNLTNRWLDLLGQLEAHAVAHGDLQHGNVLVDRRTGELRLIDLDGAWVPPIGHMPPPQELGHPNYSHPDRTQAHWGPYMDTFSALVIYLSLVALASDRWLSIDSDTGPRGLWSDFHSGENLLFKKEDFERPGQTPVWSRIGYLDNRWAGQLLQLLQRYCDPSFASNVPFSQALRHATTLEPWAPTPQLVSAPAAVVVDNSGTVWGAGAPQQVVVQEAPRRFSQPVPTPAQSRRVGVWFGASAGIAAVELIALAATKATGFLVAFCLTLAAAVILLIWMVQTNKRVAGGYRPVPAPPPPPAPAAPAVGPPPPAPVAQSNPSPGPASWRQQGN